MKDLMMTYGVIFGKRYTQKQKDMFFEQISKDFNHIGYSASAQSKSSGFVNVNNIIFGDISKAGKIIIAPYDTPSAALLPGFKYYPFSPKNNVKEERKNHLLNFLIFLLNCAAAYFLMKIAGEYSVIIKAMAFVSAALLLINSILVLNGRANKVNFNRNSAGVALAVHIAKNVGFREDIAYVFLDSAISSFNGIKQLKENIADNEQAFIMLDGLASGETLVFVHNEQPVGNLNKILNNNRGLYIFDKVYTEQGKSATVLGFFKNMAVLSSGTLESHQFSIENSRSSKDYKVDVERLEKLSLILRDFLI